MKGTSLRQLVQSMGANAAAETLMECIESKELRPTDFSIKELWEAFVGPCSETLQYARRQSGHIQLQESAVDSSIYQAIIGKVLADMVIEGYNRVASIGDLLTQKYTSKNKFEKVPGFTPSDSVKEVKENEPYAFTGIGAKYVGTGEALKKGLIIAISEEAIYFDRTGMILDQAAQIGEEARLDKEKTILRAVLGIDSCYWPSDVATALYGSGIHTLKTSNGLVDWINIETAETELADMVDEKNNPVIVTPKVLLVPSALYRTAQRIVNATEVRAHTDSAKQETILTNPMKGAYTPLTSPLIHQLQIAAGISDSVARSNWWIGDPQKQFIWREIWPIQILRAREDNESAFNSDVVVKVKVRYFGNIFARDNKYFLKSMA